MSSRLYHCQKWLQMFMPAKMFEHGSNKVLFVADFVTFDMHFMLNHTFLLLANWKTENWQVFNCSCPYMIILSVLCMFLFNNQTFCFTCVHVLTFSSCYKTPLLCIAKWFNFWLKPFSSVLYDETQLLKLYVIKQDDI